MKRVFMLAVLMSPFSSEVYAEDAGLLRSQFMRALGVVADKTNQATQVAAQIKQTPAGTQVTTTTVAGKYQNGGAQQQICSAVNSPAGQLLREVSDTVGEMAVLLYEGAMDPTDATKSEVCGVVYRGFDQARYAAVYEGYSDLHFTFKDYINQFKQIRAILACSSPF
jgi:hypothetical protein